MVGSLLFALTGCITIQVPRSADVRTDDAASSAPSAPSAVPSPDATGTVGECIDDVMRLTDSNATYDLTVVCGTLEIEGSDLVIDLERAQIGGVVIHGDRVEVDAVTLGSVVIDGDSNDVDTDALDAVVIDGDANQVDVEGDLRSAVVKGTGNRVEARSISAVVNSGSGNQILSD